MKIRGEMSVVGGGPDRDHALLAAFLEATSRIDRRVLQRSVVIGEAPRPVNAVNLEAQPTSPGANATSLEAHLASLEANPASLEVELTSTDPKARVAPFIFRRANLVRA